MLKHRKINKLIMNDIVKSFSTSEKYGNLIVNWILKNDAYFPDAVCFQCSFSLALQ